MVSCSFAEQLKFAMAWRRYATDLPMVQGHLAFTSLRSDCFWRTWGVNCHAPNLHSEFGLHRGKVGADLIGECRYGRSIQNGRVALAERRLNCGLSERKRFENAVARNTDDYRQTFPLRKRQINPTIGVGHVRSRTLRGDERDWRGETRLAARPSDQRIERSDGACAQSSR